MPALTFNQVCFCVVSDTCINSYVCVWEEGGRRGVFQSYVSQRLPVVKPGQLFTCGNWLKLTNMITILDLLVSEYRVPFDGITQFLPRLFPCRVSHQLVHIGQVECEMLLCGTWPPGMVGLCWIWIDCTTGGSGY